VDDKTKKYNAIRNRLALCEPAYAMIVVVAIQVSGLSSWIRETSTGLTGTWYAAVSVYALILGAVFYAGLLPLKFFRSYLIEKSFGLSRYTLLGWAKDEAKGALISGATFCGFAYFLYYTIRAYPDFWWIAITAIWIAFTIMLAQLAPVILLPLFYKFKPLEDQGLRDRLKGLAGRCGVRILDVFSLGLSAKTNKANAALTGIGPTRRVLLGDTLLDNYEPDEIEVVLAHELGHHKLGHIPRSILLGAAGTLLAFYLIKASSATILGSLNIGSISNVSSLPAILFALILFGAISAPIQNAYSRKIEREADLFALKNTGFVDAFVSCMQKLSSQNLSDPSPGRFIEIMLYSHPPVSKRIEMAQGFNKR